MKFFQVLRQESRPFNPLLGQGFHGLTWPRSTSTSAWTGPCPSMGEQCSRIHAPSAGQPFRNDPWADDGGMTISRPAATGGAMLSVPTLDALVLAGLFGASGLLH